jgi:hypothetical protein
MKGALRLGYWGAQPSAGQAELAVVGQEAGLPTDVDQAPWLGRRLVPELLDEFAVPVEYRQDVIACRAANIGEPLHRR